jgi:capsular polysaccharide biosynthesis protein
VEAEMILAALRAHLEGTRRIPLSIGRFLVHFTPLRRILGAPRGYRSVALSGTRDGNGNCEIESIGPVETGEEISLPPALFAIGNEVESKLLPCRFAANARYVYLLRNGKYRNTSGHFELAVLDASGRLLSELSPDAIGPDLHRIYGQFSVQKEQRIPGRAIVLTTPGARRNYFHWCLELLPKIHLLCSGRLFHPKNDIFLVNHDKAHYQIQTLALLGLQASNVVRTYPGIKITADELIVPSHSSRHEAVPRWAIQFLRGRFLGQGLAASDGKKLFLDRGAAKRRTILNQAEVQKYLRGHGYTIVDSASLSFQEQVSLFRGARSIVSCHGAGLANLCFVEAGTSLLEIFSPYYMPDYFRVLSEHLGVLYGCVSGVSSNWRAHVTERERISEPFKLPLDRLAHALEQLEHLS